MCSLDQSHKNEFISDFGFYRWICNAKTALLIEFNLIKSVKKNTIQESIEGTGRGMAFLGFTNAEIDQLW